MAKLAPGEFEQVADIVSRWPGQFPLERSPPSKAGDRHRRPTRPLLRLDRSVAPTEPIARASLSTTRKAAKEALLPPPDAQQPASR